MSNSGEIFVVTEGSYSDYSIIGVYDDEDLANDVATANTGGWNEARVETYTLNDVPVNAEVYRNTGKLRYAVYIDKNGNVGNIHRTGYYGEPEDPDGTETTIKLLPLSSFGRRSKKGEYLVRCWARDEDHAVKIANDLRREAVAHPHLLEENANDE